MLQVSAAARDPGRTYIANPPASWLDDFLSWISPGLPHCCREDPQGDPCPPPDQYPCNTSAMACADCATCFTTGSSPDPRVLPHNRPTLQQVSLVVGIASRGLCGCSNMSVGSILPDMVVGGTICCHKQSLRCGDGLAFPAPALQSSDAALWPDRQVQQPSWLCMLLVSINVPCCRPFRKPA